MPTTLPTYTKAIDNAFTETWYEIREDAIDNILLATPVWAALKERGCFKTQVGGNSIERTIKYGVGVPATAVAKGDVLGQGEYETETAGFWTWRYLSSSIQRSLFDDQKNAGKFQIKDYVKKRTKEARTSLMQAYESKVATLETTDESGKDIQSINDFLTSFNNRATGTYGGIARSNSWWQPIYQSVTNPPEVNLMSDMKHLYNSIFLNMEAPNLIITNQNTFEIYEEFALDQTQLVKESDTRLADLGFEVLKFKGKSMVWTPNCCGPATAGPNGSVLMLNTNYIDVVYDPNMWFAMTEWKAIPLQAERIAHILCAMNILTDQPRRHGRLYVNASDG